MKFRLQNEPQEVTVSAQLAVSNGQLEIRLGGFLYLKVWSDGVVEVCTFWRNSPMHDFCIKHDMKFQELAKKNGHGSGQFRLQFEVPE